MSARIITLDDLRLITGYTRAADVERCLADQGIHCFRGRDGIWTTIDLINAAGGLRPGPLADDQSPYHPDLAA